MKKSIIALLIITWFTPTMAQVSGNFQYNNYLAYNSTSRTPLSKANITNYSEINLEVNGLLNIEADNYVAIFNIVQVGETIESTDQLMRSRISGFKRKLAIFGIDTNDVKIDMLSFVPKYDIQTEIKFFSKTYNEVPAGFELQKNIAVRYRNSSKLDDIVTAASSSEIYDLVKVDYFIGNIQKSLDSLRLKCLNEIKNKVKSYEIIGFKLDTFKKIMADNFVTVYPQTRYFSYQAFSRPSLQAAKKKSQPLLNEVSKTTSKFYSQVDYDQYNIVINPMVTEPVVQVSYTVTVKYFMPQEKEEKPKNLYYILTPSGEMKLFKPQ